MTAPVFAWRPDSTQEADTKPRLRTVQFGDGYTERAPEGINSLPTTYTVKFTQRVGDGAPTPDWLWDKDDIVNFFEERGGYKPFYFSITDSPRIALVVCTEWKASRNDGGAWEIDATFVQDFSEPNAYQYLFDLWGNSYAMIASLQALENFVNGPAGSVAA